jgi:hypothetical protein
MPVSTFRDHARDRDDADGTAIAIYCCPSMISTETWVALLGIVPRGWGVLHPDQRDRRTPARSRQKRTGNG